ncbi:MAG: hypothetical protein R2695_01570 [Acidimicrobiales bacterium]
MHLVVGVLGALLAAATLGSAIRTVVVPRGEETFIARLAVIPVRALFDKAARRTRDPVRQDAIKARFGPTALMLFPFVWAVGVIGGCSATFWALGCVRTATPSSCRGRRSPRSASAPRAIFPPSRCRSSRDRASARRPADQLPAHHLRGLPGGRPRWWPSCTSAPPVSTGWPARPACWSGAT